MRGQGVQNWSWLPPQSMSGLGLALFGQLWAPWVKRKGDPGPLSFWQNSPLKTWLPSLTQEPTLAPHSRLPAGLLPPGRRSRVSAGLHSAPGRPGTVLCSPLPSPEGLPAPACSPPLRNLCNPPPPTPVQLPVCAFQLLSLLWPHPFVFSTTQG